MLRAEKKFLGPIRRVFETAAPGRHVYVVVGPAEEGFVLPEGVIRAVMPSEVRDVVAGRSDWEGVVVSGPTFATAGSCIDRLPRDVAIAWYVWGYEAYGYFDRLRARLLLPKTERVQDILDAPSKFQVAAAGRARRHVRRVVRRTEKLLRVGSARDASRLLGRLDFCVTSLRDEYELFLTSGLRKTTQYHWGLVGSLEDYVDVRENSQPGEDFQLGNSASTSNNHLDAFALFQGADRDSRRVITPLSYGDLPYRGVVVAAGREALGDRFVPLTEFMPIEEYRAVIRSCGHVVMNQRRQQALGNIYDALWRGARVYLNDTTAYRGLRATGLNVRSIAEDLGGAERKRQLPVPQDELLRHRALLLQYYARARVAAEAIDLLERMSFLTRRRSMSVVHAGVRAEGSRP